MPVGGSESQDAITYNIIKAAATGNGNVGGLPRKFSRIELDYVTKHAAQSISLKPGESIRLPFKYFMPMTVPVNVTIEKEGIAYGQASEFPDAPLTDTITCAMLGVTKGQYKDISEYPHGVSGNMYVEKDGAEVWFTSAWTNNKIPNSPWKHYCSF